MSALTLSSRIWSGSASNAYRDFAKDLVEAHDETEARAHSAADRFRSYALQLTWRQEDMARHRSDATSGGLTVTGTRILEPVPVTRPTMPDEGATQAQVDQYNSAAERYNAALRRIDLYRTIAVDVRGTFERLDDWIVDNLVPEEEKVQAPSPVGPMAAAARALPDFVVATS